MAIGDQGTQAQALGLDASQIADAVNRQKIGSQRQRNEMMRLGTSDPNAFALQNKRFLQQPEQPQGLGNLFGNQQQQFDSPEQPSYTSISDLQSAIAPPDNRTSLQKLFGAGDENYVMPQNQLLNNQKATTYDIMGKRPDAFAGQMKKFVSNPDYDQLNRDAILKNPLDDITNAKVFGAYSPLAHQADPMVKFLNSKYPFNGAGWELGDGRIYAPSKDASSYGNFSGTVGQVSRENVPAWYNGPEGVRRAAGGEESAPTSGTSGMFDYLQSARPDPFTDEGKFNSKGWKVTKPTSHAKQGILGTLSVIAPALFYGLGMLGTAGEAGAGAGATAGEGGASVAGSSAAIPAGSEGLMTGSLATEAAPAAAGSNAGMFGNSNMNLGDAWLNRAGEGAIRGAVGSGGNLKSTLGGAVSGGMSTVMNDSLANLGKYLTEQGLPSNVANSIMDFTSGAGGSLVKNLWGKNTGQEMLQGALTSGIGKTLGGIYNQNANITDPFQQRQNYGAAQTLAQLFRRIK